MKLRMIGLTMFVSLSWMVAGAFADKSTPFVEINNQEGDVSEAHGFVVALGKEEDSQFYLVIVMTDTVQFVVIRAEADKGVVDPDVLGRLAVIKAEVMKAGKAMRLKILAARECEPADHRPARVPSSGPADALTELLLQEFILPNGKISGQEIDAAIVLLCGRGRNSHRVLAEFEASEPGSERERRLLSILARILAQEGHARWLQGHPEELARSASPPSVILGERGIDAVIERAGKIDRKDIAPFVAAAALAFDPRTEPFLMQILSAPQPPVSMMPGEAAPPPAGGWIDYEACFCAAAGLAQLGEPAGVEWLLGQVDPRAARQLVTLRHARHSRVPSGELAQSCAYALADLSGREPGTETEWQEWWAENREFFAPVRRVSLDFR